MTEAALKLHRDFVDYCAL